MATAEAYARNDDVNINEVIQNLSELFGDVLDNDVIQSVAVSCSFNLEVTTNALLEMLNNVDNSNIETKPEPSKTIHQNGVGFSYATAASSQKHRDNADVVIESEKFINSKPSASNIHMEPTKNILVKSHQRSKKELELERVIQHVRQESRVLILMRGLPGSGKSYLARRIVDRSVGMPDYHLFILSTDDYFYNQRKKMYVYDLTKLQEAHEWNQQRAYMKMSSGISPVIIDNTHTQMWETKPYATMAANFGYVVEVVETFTSWAFDVKQLFLRNKHNVPKIKLQDMLLRYEKDITPTNIFATYNLSYGNLIPPVKRTFPPLKSTSTFKNTTGSIRNNSTSSSEIDLMQFKEESNTPDGNCVSVENNEAVRLNSLQNQNSNLFDSFLTNSQINTETVLRPHVSNFQSINDTTSLQTPPNAQNYSPTSVQSLVNSNKMDVRNSNFGKNPVKKPKDVYPTLNLSSWGLSEEAVSSWESWDMVTPLTKTNSYTEAVDVTTTETPKQIQKANASTNTSSRDFSLLDTNCLTLHSDSVSIIRATGRDINADNLPASPTTPPKRILLHKSSMTNEDVLDMDIPKEDVIVDEHLQQLLSLFPSIHIDYLQDVYEKCGKNINWTVDLLLDDNKEILTDFNQKRAHKNVLTNNLLPELSETVVNGDSEASYDQAKLDSSTPVDANEIDMLKKHIEQRVEINRDFYSDHVMKIKNLKRSSDSTCKNLNQPTSSTASAFELYPTTSEEVIALNTDVNVDEFEPDIDFPQNDEAEEQQTVEINLGESCINQLESIFGFPEIFPKGFLPVVQIPLELAEQLHAFYIQSVLGQMEAQNNVLDMITKEDEELAKKLQSQDEDVNDADNKKTVYLQDIMKEQVADKMYRKKIDEWKKLTPDTLASKLTIQKLTNSFPSIDRTVLVEILHAHNNSYVQTVEVLLASTDTTKVHDPDGNIREPPISDVVINDMKKARDEKMIAENAPDVSKTANEYREEANDYHRKHNECMQKAQKAFQNRQYPVAQFYSDLAKSYTQLYEQTNSLAATAFLQEHSSRLQNFHTLDLHYLYVKEAVSALDMFLDSNIRLMSDSYKKNENLFIITGRGKRSLGKSRLKPAVIARLKKRGLYWLELNPGLLKVKIHPHSAITNNV